MTGRTIKSAVVLPRLTHLAHRAAEPPHPGVKLQVSGCGQFLLKLPIRVLIFEVLQRAENPDRMHAGIGVRISSKNISFVTQ